MKTHYSEEEKKHVCTICGYRLNDTISTSSYNRGIHNFWKIKNLISIDKYFHHVHTKKSLFLLNIKYISQHKKILNLSN